MESSTTTAIANISDDLPKEIVLEVLSRLTVKSVCRLRCLSKSFSSLLSEMHFINNHLRHSSLHPSIIVSEWNRVFLIGSLNLQSHIGKQLVRFPNSYTRIDVLGSANGLLFVVADESRYYSCTSFLWNPSTQQSDVIPISNAYCGRLMGSCWGFGYSNVFNLYKIVRIVFMNDFYTFRKPMFLAEVLAYSEHCEWRTVDFTDFSLLPWGYGLAIQNILYWKIERYDHRLLSFDLDNELFDWIICPVPLNGEIMEIREMLTLSHISEIDANLFDLWVLRDRFSWEKLYTINQFTHLYPVHCINDRFLLLENSCLETENYLLDMTFSYYLYDIESEQVKQITGLLYHPWRNIHTVVEGLVPLNASTSVSRNFSLMKIDDGDYNDQPMNDEGGSVCYDAINNAMEFTGPNF